MDYGERINSTGTSHFSDETRDCIGVDPDTLLQLAVSVVGHHADDTDQFSSALDNGAARVTEKHFIVLKVNIIRRVNLLLIFDPCFLK